MSHLWSLLPLLFILLSYQFLIQLPIVRLPVKWWAGAPWSPTSCILQELSLPVLLTTMEGRSLSFYKQAQGRNRSQSFLENSIESISSEFGTLYHLLLSVSPPAPFLELLCPDGFSYALHLLSLHLFKNQLLNKLCLLTTPWIHELRVALRGSGLQWFTWLSSARGANEVRKTWHPRLTPAYCSVQHLTLAWASSQRDSFRGVFKSKPAYGRPP